MIRAFAVFATILLLTACSAGAEAEKRYKIADEEGGYAERCKEAGKVAEAYLDDGNREKYREWNDKAKTDCSLARLQAATF